MRAVLPPARWIGPAVIAGLAGAWAVLWFVAGPPGQPAVAYLGQFFGAESVLLLSMGLVLISTLPWCEALFDGIDRAAIWHRRVAITGMILLVPHIVLSANPHHSSLGPLLGVIGAAGLLILAVWAILPRWRSAASPACVVCAGRWAATNSGVPHTGLPGCSWRPVSPMACSTARHSPTPRCCGGVMSPSAAPAWRSTSIANCSPGLRTALRLPGCPGTPGWRWDHRNRADAARPPGHLRAGPVRHALPGGHRRLAPP